MKRRLLTATVVLVVLGGVLYAFAPKTPNDRAYQSDTEIRSTFDLGREGWRVYEYHDGQPNIFNKPTVRREGGVDGGAYIEARSTQWTEDTPESPHSVLALLTYRRWMRQAHFDLRDRTLTVSLKGSGLDLKGAKVYFWVMVNSTRFHYVAFPLDVTNDAWTTSTFPIRENTALWNVSWAGNGQAESLGNVLNAGLSYGFSFVGFPDGDVPTGSLLLDDFSIR